MSEKLKNFTQSLPGQHSELLVTCGSAVAQSVPAPLSPLQKKKNEENDEKDENDEDDED